MNWSVKINCNLLSDNNFKCSAILMRAMPHSIFVVSLAKTSGNHLVSRNLNISYFNQLVKQSWFKLDFWVVWINSRYKMSEKHNEVCFLYI